MKCFKEKEGKPEKKINKLLCNVISGTFLSSEYVSISNYFFLYIGQR